MNKNIKTTIMTFPVADYYYYYYYYNHHRHYCYCKLQQLCQYSD